MNARALQEFRLILWPWCLMIVAGLLPFIRPFLADQKTDWPEGLAVLGFFGGAVMATGLSFRNALQIRPPALPQTGGVNRQKLWLEKMAVLMAAAVSAGLIVCFIQTLSGNL